MTCGERLSCDMRSRFRAVMYWLKTRSQKFSGVRCPRAGVAFLREWVVPRYCRPEREGEVGFGIEVFMYAQPADSARVPRPERAGLPTPRWVPLSEILGLPLWAKELKSLAGAVNEGEHLLVYGHSLRGSTVHATCRARRWLSMSRLSSLASRDVPEVIRRSDDLWHSFRTSVLAIFLHGEDKCRTDTTYRLSRF